MVEQELTADEASLGWAAERMKESAELFGRHTDSLLAAVSGGGRSPWGVGVISAAMDRVNETLGEACSHLQANLGAIGAGIATTAARQHAAEYTTAAAALAVGKRRSG